MSPHQALNLPVPWSGTSSLYNCKCLISAFLSNFSVQRTLLQGWVREGLGNEWIIGALHLRVKHNPPFILKMFLGASKMSHWLKRLATKPYGLSLNPRAHTLDVDSLRMSMCMNSNQILFFFITDKMLERSNLREEEVILAHSLEEFRPAWWGRQSCVLGVRNTPGTCSVWGTGGGDWGLTAV